MIMLLVVVVSCCYVIIIIAGIISFVSSAMMHSSPTVHAGSFSQNNLRCHGNVDFVFVSMVWCRWGLGVGGCYRTFFSSPERGWGGRKDPHVSCDS